MRFYTHIVVSILFFLTFANLINLNGIIVGIIVSGGISIFPDIIDKVGGKHRGIGHSVIWLIPFIIILYTNFIIGSALIIGFISHIILDSFTWIGSPFFYPFFKIDFVSLNKRNRIRTGSNQEKAIFIFTLILLIAVILFTFGVLSNFTLPLGQNSIFSTGEASGAPLNNYNIKNPSKNSININLQLNSNSTKNITIHQVNENDTNVVVENLIVGGLLK